MTYLILSTIDRSVLSCSENVCFHNCKDCPQVKEKWSLKKCSEDGWCCYEVKQDKIVFANIPAKVKKQFVKTYFNAFIDCTIDSLRNKEMNKIEKNTNDIIVHNSKNIHANIVSKFQNIFPELDEQKNKLDYIQNRLNENNATGILSRELLSIWKSLSQQAFHYSVADYIETSQLALSDFGKHKIFTILQMAFFQYEDDFKEKKIDFNPSEFRETIYCNFDTIKAAFCALLENSIKYCRPSTSLDVSFDIKDQKIIVKISMHSRFIEPNEIPNLFNYGTRGRHVTDLPGKGIGLWIIKKMIELNYGEFSIIPSESHYQFDGNEYAYNFFLFSFNRNRFQIINALNQ